MTGARRGTSLLVASLSACAALPRPPTRSTSAATRSSTAPSTSRSSRPSTSTSTTTRRKPRRPQIVARHGRALVRAAVAVLRPRAARPAGRSFSTRSSAHFRQTNAVEGLIGEGTGGVTEALKRRIVLPMSGSLADTDHVLGHELVHAFQFDITGADPRDGGGQAPGILAFPLWFVEGHGRVPVARPGRRADGDVAARRGAAREAAAHQDLDDPKYFPYRWGHAFWAYIGAKYGDRTVASLIRSAANPRFDLVGLARQLGTDPDTLTAEWHARHPRSRRAAVADELPPLDERAAAASSARTAAAAASTSARASVPTARQIAFFSERDRFSVELYLADAETGQIERQAAQVGDRSALRQPRVPELGRRLESRRHARSRSPRCAAGGRCSRCIDPQSGRVRREMRARRARRRAQSGVRAGRPVGRVQRQRRRPHRSLPRRRSTPGALERLTHDPFADLEPTFTPDGRSIVFVTERFTHGSRRRSSPGRCGSRASIWRRATCGRSPAFLRGKHLSPQVSADGRTRHVHRRSRRRQQSLPHADRRRADRRSCRRCSTGVAGITSSSPALSVGAATGRLVFSVFEDDGHVDLRARSRRTSSRWCRREATRAGGAAAGPDRRRPATSSGCSTDYARGLPAARRARRRRAVRPEADARRDRAADDHGRRQRVRRRTSAAACRRSSATCSATGRSASAAQVGGTLADFGGQLVVRQPAAPLELGGVGRSRCRTASATST